MSAPEFCSRGPTWGSASGRRLLFSDNARLENSVSVNGGRSPTGVVDYYTAA
eukprot:COSAG01_NODE_51232_length_356_cov_1.066148_1_plen_51_part_01